LKAQNATDQSRTTLINPAAYPNQPTPPASTNEFQKDDIYIEYYEKSRRAAITSRLEEYLAYKPAEAQLPPCRSIPDNKLWSLFKSHANFEFMKVMLKAALSKDQIKGLIKTNWCCIDGEDTFNLTSHGEIHGIWADASAIVSPVSISDLF
jgi:hypothetical protein